jgi:hypothetical protein
MCHQFAFLGLQQLFVVIEIHEAIVLKTCRPETNRKSRLSHAVSVDKAAAKLL